MRYEQPKAGEWVYPKRRNYKLACCDCGLVHRFNFRLITRSNGGRLIQFQAFRDNRATAQIRRHSSKRKKK